MIQYQPLNSQRTVTNHTRIKNCMAETMREMANGDQTVSVETLQARGFTLAAINRFSADAIDIARRRSVRRIEHAA